MRNAILLSLSLVFGLTGCDEIVEPDNPVPGPCAGGGNGFGFRRVLLEDLTGFRCPNCPAAGDVAKQLEGIYCGDVVVVAVHCTTPFASPTTTPPDPFSTDFRTVAGEAYVTTFQPPGLPNGLVSRKEYDGSVVVGPSAWSSAVAVLLGQPAEFEVAFDTVIYDAGTETLDLKVKVDALTSNTGDYNVVVYLLESDVIEGQLDNRVPGGIVYPYTHNHMLRDNINGTWGTQAFTGTITAGQSTTLSFDDYVLAATVLEPANCSLVAYIYRVDNDEVMQVSEQELIP
ncbi:MAG: Omp28-related outer membrane protein [Flavobacteriales bacterium]